MENGIYKVSFETPLGHGFGIVVISDGTVKGGDSSMYYVGTFKETENQFTANLHVRKHSSEPGISSVFGVDDVHLTLQGTSANTSANVTGNAAEAPSIQFQAQLNLLE